MTQRDERGLFQRGNTVSKGKGRPKGSRSSLSETFLKDLKAEWLRSGADALQRFAESDPAAFCRCVASLIPREVLLQNAGPGGLTLQVITGVPPAEVEEPGITIDQAELDRIHEPLSRARPTATPIVRSPADRAAMREIRRLQGVPPDLRDT